RVVALPATEKMETVESDRAASEAVERFLCLILSFSERIGMTYILEYFGKGEFTRGGFMQALLIPIDETNLGIKHTNMSPQIIHIMEGSSMPNAGIDVAGATRAV
ncbi:hypothetical protein ACJX0J_031733, partial [Zea mays]